MTRLELRRVAGKHLRRIDLSLDSGIHALVEAPGNEAAELVSICSGLVRPKKGSVHLNAERPFQSPRARRKIGALFRVEEPLEGPTVDVSVSRALLLHGHHGRARDLFAPFGLESLLLRSPGSLSPLETRTVALALALGVTAPDLLVLYEPFSAGLGRREVDARLTDRAAEGTVVLIVLASLRDAVELRANPIRLSSLVVVRNVKEGARP